MIFPGRNIGDLAVNGTVNDLAMCGPRPLYLSAGSSWRKGWPSIEDAVFINTAGIRVVKLATKEEIQEAMQEYEYADGEMKDILAVTDGPLVSTDLKGSTYSSIFGASDTLVIGNMVKVVAWYDKEWGYACRTADLATLMATKLPADVDEEASFAPGDFCR